METNDMDRLCSLLRKLPLWQLQCLDDLKLSWLPRVSEPTVAANVAAIGACLQSLPSPQERLDSVAELCCWLTSVGTFRSWTLYRLDVPVHQLNHVTFLEKLSANMQSGGFPGARGRTDTGDFACFCLLQEDDRIRTIRCRLVCFCMWNGLPFLAVRAPGGIAHRGTLRAALSSVGIDTEKCLHGRYDHLSAVQSQVMKYQCAETLDDDIIKSKRHT
ncbi:hypothetical protein HPB50_026670 [Hyalomma asiaticum]|uniref:Uncharacterized protein n=1 Tax=Hyalomma asiaticum TaxID=266040 RepID=A0ACB7RU12_HYAAI|nr:hypothetical protein HPB50_026670 [Hyalomma asiaticum]